MEICGATNQFRVSETKVIFYFLSQTFIKCLEFVELDIC